MTAFDCLSYVVLQTRGDTSYQLESLFVDSPDAHPQELCLKFYEHLPARFVFGFLSSAAW
jgi:hypothetical protein